MYSSEKNRRECVFPRSDNSTRPKARSRCRMAKKAAIHVITLIRDGKGLALRVIRSVCLRTEKGRRSSPSLEDIVRCCISVSQRTDSRECPERDLNSYALSSAAPSRRCVCQFHHPGNGKSNIQHHCATYYSRLAPCQSPICQCERGWSRTIDPLLKRQMLYP